MSEMTDRVAWILLDIGIDHPDNERIARRIIEAMREPTREMVLEGEEFINSTPHFSHHARDTWVVMLSTALREKVDA